MREPLINDLWKDSRGETVTIVNVLFNRVTFVREKYEHPCVYPKDRFSREFTLLEVRS